MSKKKQPVKKKAGRRAEQAAKPFKVAGPDEVAKLKKTIKQLREDLRCQKKLVSEFYDNIMAEEKQHQGTIEASKLLVDSLRAALSAEEALRKELERSVEVRDASLADQRALVERLNRDLVETETKRQTLIALGASELLEPGRMAAATESFKKAALALEKFEDSDSADDEDEGDDDDDYDDDDYGAHHADETTHLAEGLSVDKVLDLPPAVLAEANAEYEAEKVKALAEADKEAP